MKKIGFLAILFLAGCSLNQDVYIPSPSEQQNRQQPTNNRTSQVFEQKKLAPIKKSVDWVGYYYGVLPCATCSGVETWLHLSKDDNKAIYELSENYLQMSDGVFESYGDVSWKEELVAKLDGKGETRYIFLGKNSVTFVSTLDAPLQNTNTLKKLDTFTKEGEELLVIPNSIQKGRLQNKKAVKFHALVNFEHANEQGFKSLKVSYGIECQANTYSILKRVFFEGRFATGKFEEGKEVKNVHFEEKDSVLKQAKDKYCS